MTLKHIHSLLLCLAFSKITTRLFMHVHRTNSRVDVVAWPVNLYKMADPTGMCDSHIHMQLAWSF